MPTQTENAGSSSNPLLTTLRGIALLVSVVATLLIPVVAYTTTNQPEIWTACLVAAASWIAVFMLRTRLYPYVAHLLIFTVLGIATYGVHASGSVRSAVVFLFVGAVAAAGVFLERKAVVVATGFSVAILAVFTWMEVNGYMHKPNIDVGIKVWATQAISLVVVGIMVYFSRARATESHNRQLNELLRRRETEHERDLAQERFARIFKASPSPMIAQSAVTSLILDVNPAFERCFGYIKAELVGRSDTFLWVQTESRFSYKERLFTQQRLHQEPARGRRSDGTEFEATLSSELSNEPGDELIITIVADVSSENAALDKLRRSEERFAKAFNFSPLHLTIARMSDGSAVEANHSASGTQKDSKLDTGSLEVEFWSNASTRNSLRERMIAEGGLRAYDTQVQQKNGATVDCRIWAELIEIDGESCVISCAVNVSEEKRREAQLLDLAQGMASHTGHAFFEELVGNMAKTMGADMVLVGESQGESDMETLATWVDGANAANFSYPLEGTPCQLASDRSDLCIYPDNVDDLFPTDLALVEGGFKSYVGQSLRDESGKTIGVLVAMWRKPIANQSESAALMAIYGGRANAELLRLQRDREIQNLNETLEHRVRTRTSELQTLNAELDSFAYSVSHDLKTPLRSIDGFTQLLEEHLEGRLSPTELGLFKRILSSTKRMSVLIADLLALARISQSELSWQWVNLSDMAQDVLATLTTTKYAGRKINLHVEKKLVARCDPQLTRIALENLLDNAAKYTRDQPDAVIEFGRDAGDARSASRFYVRDNGTGFDMTMATGLFKPFQRLHAPSSGFEGTGIGLATVRRIVERHGGEIYAEAEEGQGATFHFTLGRSIGVVLAPAKPGGSGKLIGPATENSPIVQAHDS